MLVGMRRPLGWVPLLRPVTRRRWFSNASSDKGFQIPAHMLNFSLFIAPCVIYVIYAGNYGPSEEVLEERIRERYDVAAVHQKNEGLKEFFQKAELGLEDDRLQQVLHGGKTDQKRHFAVDKELYGTEQGLVIKQQTEEEIKARAEEKKRRKELRRQRRKEKGVVAAEDVTASTDTKSNTSTQSESVVDRLRLHSIVSKPVVQYAVVGSLAILVGYLAGSRRN